MKCAFSWTPLTLVALGRFPTLLSSWWHFVPNLKRLCLPASSSRFQIEQFQELFGERVSEWKVNTDVSYLSGPLSSLLCPPFPAQVVLSKRENPTWEADVPAPAGGESQALGRLQPQCGCTLFAGSRMFFLWWARDFSSSNSDVEHQPQGLETPGMASQKRERQPPV